MSILETPWPQSSSSDAGVLFRASRGLRLLEQFCVPHRVDAQRGGSDLERIEATASRGALLWTTQSDGEAVGARIDDAGGSPGPRILAPILNDIRAGALLTEEGGRWSPIRRIETDGGSPVGSIWASGQGDIFLPFDPDAVFDAFLNEGYVETLGGAPGRAARRDSTAARRHA